MQKTLLTLLLLASALTSKAQTAQAADFGKALMLHEASTRFESKALQRTVDIRLHLPEEWYLTEEIDYPVLVLFDSQHAMTYPFLLHAIDLLISNAQLPQMIVVGIPFDGEERRAMTSQGAKAEATARFLNQELLPHLKAEYKAQERVMVAGHSRTGFFTSYLVAHHPETLNAAVSLSAFFEEGFMPEDVRHVMRRLEQLERPFSWYVASGTSIEDATYLKDQQVLRDSLDMIYQRRPQTICQLRKIDHTNHMSTYMQGLQWALIDYFSGYERILDHWLFEKGETIAPEKALLAFASDFRRVSEETGTSVQPSIIHFWSIASMFLSRGENATFQQFIELALKVFPKEYSFAEELGLLALERGDRETAGQYLNQALQLLETYPFVSDAEREEAKQAIQERLAE